MAQVLIRGLDDEVVERLRDRARAGGRSLESELRIILNRAASWRGWDESRIVSASRVGEEAPDYQAADESEESQPRFPNVPGIRWARPGAYLKPVEPLPLKGKPISEMLIEDRR